MADQLKNFTKVDDNTMSVDRVKAEETVTVKYDYGYLLRQKAAIQAQKDRDNALRDAELVEVQKLIDEADKLGIVS